MHDPADTIVALASAPGPGARAIVRLSGPETLRIAGTVFTSPSPLDLARQGAWTGAIRLPNVASPLPADLFLWPAPRTYTGQAMAELHTISSPPLIDLVVAQLLNAGAARPSPANSRCARSWPVSATCRVRKQCKPLWPRATERN